MAVAQPVVNQCEQFACRGDLGDVLAAGPAGLEAARRLATRGASVTLFESSTELGGRLAQWSKAPSRHEVMNYVAWQQRELVRFGVDIRLATRADADAVAAFAPDVVILATGAPDLPVDVPNNGTVNVLTADNVFAQSFTGSAVVHDVPDAIDAMLIAEYLVERGLPELTVSAQ